MADHSTTGDGSRRRESAERQHPAPPGRPPRARIYLLRIWEEREGAPEVVVVWRFSLEEPGTGQRRGFAALAALTAFLDGQLAMEPP
jgi:hypothetical protein